MNIESYAAKGTDEILKLPISAVTEDMGTEGLRIRFAREVKQAFDDPEIIEMAGRAHYLGAHLHRYDRRSHEPVEHHLLRGGIRVLSDDHLGYKDQFMPVIMLLHDGVEDHPHALAEVQPDVPTAEASALALGKIATRFAPKAAYAVEWMTNPLPESGKTSHEQYFEHGIELVRRGPARAVVGKYADFFDNGTGIIWSKYATPEQFMRWADKYIQFVPILQRGLERPDLGLSEKAVEYAKTQFTLTVENCAKVIDAQGIRPDFLSTR